MVVKSCISALIGEFSGGIPRTAELVRCMRFVAGLEAISLQHGILLWSFCLTQTGFLARWGQDVDLLGSPAFLTSRARLNCQNFSGLLCLDVLRANPQVKASTAW